jgi:hypothetical protein
MPAAEEAMGIDGLESNRQGGREGSRSILKEREGVNEERGGRLAGDWSWIR